MHAAAVPIRLHYEVELAYQVRRGGSDFIFNVQAARTPRQQVLSETLTLSQGVSLQEDVDPASAARFLRLRAQAGDLVLRYAALVELRHHREPAFGVHEAWIPSMPGAVLPFLYPSRYCESDKLNSFAMAQFGQLWQGYGRVQAICDWVQRNVQFASGSSSGTTSAVDTLQLRRGVCRDAAHLMIALCRAVNIPARFTTGLDYGADPALGPPDFHAYVEAWLAGRWYIFDPSGTAIPEGFVRLASGRDAADSAYASIFGDVVPIWRKLHIEARPGAGGMLRLPAHTADALSTDDGPPS
jgi:transglutaminase-like putative cysteine protease